MDKYRFNSDEYEILSNSMIPLAAYQFIDRRVVTLLLSKGFCDLFGFDDLAEAFFIMDNDMYRDAHPDDVVRIQEDAYNFAVEDCGYDVIYRNKSPKDREYRIIHAQGYHEYKEDGTRIAMIWYTDEGTYTESKGQYSSRLNRLYNDVMHRRSLTHKTTYDPLTGLPNINYFFQLSESGRDSLLQDERQPAMVYFDLNGMTDFNNKYGFYEGDRLLRAFAELLVKYFSKENCGRFGQDHFVVYADDFGLTEKLDRLFEDLKTINEGRTLTARAGIFLKIIGKTLDAGVACDRAKAAADSITNIQESGYRYFDKEMQEEIDHRQYIIDNLDRAIEEKWIKVYFQPIVRAANGRVCDEEALARWVDPEKGLLSPADFIPILEKERLIYKVDLYVVDCILDKIAYHENAGLYIVPQSVNLSRYDFEACDIVEEITRRVDAAGISHDKLTIEITESVIGSDYAFMKKQVERFHALGFNVWMDDFGSEYSSLDYLQSLPFDLIKLDMRFMKQFYESEKTRIIVTELVRMALNLGIETVTEGVEDEAQVEFLQEIGCSKLQGYYYTKPLPPEVIVERYRKGIQIGFENPDEADYYEAIGNFNLYDVTALGRDETGTLKQYFNTLPMAIFETEGDDYEIIRSNSSFKRFKSTVSPDAFDVIHDGVCKCGTEGGKLVVDRLLDNGYKVHIYFKRAAVNNITGKAAVVVAILSIAEKSDEATGLTYVSIARALSSDYFNLFYVDLETEDYVEYSTDSIYGGLDVDNHGSDFFARARSDAEGMIYKPDLKDFLDEFTRENVMHYLDIKGMFTLTYRQMFNGEPVYVSMKATRIGDDDRHIIIGVNNVDTEMRHKAELEKIAEERAGYAKLTALTGDYIAFYTIDAETDTFVEYNASDLYSDLGLRKKGNDFFNLSRREASRTIYPQDVDHFLASFSKQQILDSIEKNGFYSLQYRLMMDNEPIYVHLKAALIEEDGEQKIIIGVNNVDARVRQDMENEKNLSELRKVSYGDLSNEDKKLQCMVDHIGKPTAVLSVKRKPDGSCGEIRIVKANNAYIGTMGGGFTENMLYYELVPRDIKFEDYCFRAAVLGNRMHSYVETKVLKAWTDFELVPINLKSDDLYYCLFIFEFTKGPEAARMTDVSVTAAASVIEACIKIIGAEDLKVSVGEVLEDIRTIAEASVCRVILVDHDAAKADSYSAAFGENVTLSSAVLSYDLVSTWESMIDASNAVIVKDEHDMAYLAERNPQWAEALRRDGVESLIFVPLYNNGSIFGYLYMVNYNVANVVELKETLELLSFFLGSEIAARLLMERMENMLYTDALTGVNNRHAMASRISEMDNKRFGIVSIDLNGLKSVNDTLGHDEGDKLIIKAAEALGKEFYMEDIFRIGGDEFVVIMPGITKAAFERKTARLSSEAGKREDISFAIGSCWSDGSIAPIEALKTADDRMYEDKRSYYRENPGRMCR